MGNTTHEKLDRTQIKANSICFLPLIGWRPTAPSGLKDAAGAELGADAKAPLMQCMGRICAAWVGMPQAEDPHYGVCGVAALPVIVSQLPANALYTQQQFMKAQAEQADAPVTPADEAASNGSGTAADGADGATP